jgi:hypothetical protein
VTQNDPMTIDAAARWWARRCGTAKPHRATLIRWATRGCRGRRLRAELHGGRWYVTEQSLRDFHRHLNELPAAAQDRAAGPVRAAEIGSNVCRLEAFLAGADLP